MEEIEITQEEIDKINKEIPFVDGKIYWKEGYGWTSKYWEILSGAGWKMVEEEPGVLLAVNELGQVIFSADSKISFLKQLVYIMIGGR